MINFIERIRNKLSIAAEKYEKRINMDLAFWIKYRPSTWSSHAPKKFVSFYKLSFDKKISRRVVFCLILFCSLIFIGLLPTINFIFSNFWRLWLIPILTCLCYWIVAFVVVYLRFIIFVLKELIFIIFDNFISR